MLFALGDENADARIEQFIAAALESQDAHRRVFRQPDPAGRLAAPLPIAHGRGVLGAARRPEGTSRPEGACTAKPSPQKPRAGEAEARTTSLRTGWGSFGDLDESPETARKRFAPSHPLLTDAEIEELKREIEREP